MMFVFGSLWVCNGLQTSIFWVQGGRDGLVSSSLESHPKFKDILNALHPDVIVAATQKVVTSNDKHLKQPEKNL